MALCFFLRYRALLNMSPTRLNADDIATDQAHHKHETQCYQENEGVPRQKQIVHGFLSHPNA